VTHPSYLQNAQAGRRRQDGCPRKVLAARPANAGLVAPAVQSRRLQDDDLQIMEALNEVAANVDVQTATPPVTIERNVHHLVLANDHGIVCSHAENGVADFHVALNGGVQVNPL